MRIRGARRGSIGIPRRLNGFEKVRRRARLRGVPDESTACVAALGRSN